MKSAECPRCGSNEFYEEENHVFCAYCQSRLMPEVDAHSRKQTVIDVQSDIQALLNKCIEDPINRRRYASLVLDIDPTNREALKYLS